MVEFVAGRVEPNETLVDAARRECREEIGIAPEKNCPAAQESNYAWIVRRGGHDFSLCHRLIDNPRWLANNGRRGAPSNHANVHRRCNPRTQPIHYARQPLVIGLQWLALNREQLPNLLA